MSMKTEDILNAYEEILSEGIERKKQLDVRLEEIAGERQKLQEKNKRIESIKTKLAEKRELETEKAKLDEKVDKVLNKEPKEEVKEDKVEEILKKIEERKQADILKKIQERKEADKEVVKEEVKPEEKEEVKPENKEVVKEKKEVRVGVLLESVDGDKKKHYQVYKEDVKHFYLLELGTKKTYRIAKEKVELE